MVLQQVANLWTERFCEFDPHIFLQFQHRYKMTATFKAYSIGALIARAKKREADSCGMEDGISALIQKLQRLEYTSSRYIAVNTVTLNEEELALLGYL